MDLSSRLELTELALCTVKHAVSLHPCFLSDMLLPPIPMTARLPWRHSADCSPVHFTFPVGLTSPRGPPFRVFSLSLLALEVEVQAALCPPNGTARRVLDFCMSVPVYRHVGSPISDLASLRTALRKSDLAPLSNRTHLLRGYSSERNFVSSPALNAPALELERLAYANAFYRSRVTLRVFTISGYLISVSWFANFCMRAIDIASNRWRRRLHVTRGGAGLPCCGRKAIQGSLVCLGTLKPLPRRELIGRGC